MKKIVVTSDSHGKKQNIYKIYKEHRDADMFIHLGDYAGDVEVAEKKLKINAVCIKANGDISSHFPLKQVIGVEDRRILAVHGHIERVKWSMLRLNYLAQENKADIVLFGHTHIPIVNNNGILYVNPGYAYAGQYAIVTVENGTVNASLYKL